MVNIPQLLAKQIFQSARDMSYPCPDELITDWHLGGSRKFATKQATTHWAQPAISNSSLQKSNLSQLMSPCPDDIGVNTQYKNQDTQNSRPTKLKLSLSDETR